MSAKTTLNIGVSGLLVGDITWSVCSDMATGRVINTANSTLTEVSEGLYLLENPDVVTQTAYVVFVTSSPEKSFHGIFTPEVLLVVSLQSVSMEPVAGVRLAAQLRYPPQTVNGQVIDSTISEVFTDDAGNASLTLLQGLIYTIFFAPVGTRLVIRPPEGSSQINLADYIGQDIVVPDASLVVLDGGDISSPPPKRYVFFHRRGPDAQRLTLVLGPGEIFQSTDTGMFWGGDGVTPGGISGFQGADMLKSVYDVNGDGIVDVAAVANEVSWDNIPDKPISFEPSFHAQSANTIDENSTRQFISAALKENIPSDEEKAALAGTGIPSGENPFVSNDDPRLTDARTPTSHQHTQGDSHNDADTDSGGTALHHTLGTGTNQAARGSHDHDTAYAAKSSEHGHANKDILDLLAVSNGLLEYQGQPVAAILLDTLGSGKKAIMQAQYLGGDNWNIQVTTLVEE